MPWKVEFHGDSRILETVYRGVVDPNELKQAIETAIVEGRRERAIRFLSDCSELVGGHSLHDLYAMLDMMDRMEPSREYREAVIYKKGAWSDQQVAFWETACLNRGRIVRMFESRDRAIEWLLHFPAVQGLTPPA